MLHFLKCSGQSQIKKEIFPVTKATCFLLFLSLIPADETPS